MQDVVITLEDRPGALAEVGQALGEAGINIAGLFAFSLPPIGTAHVLVEDASAAQGAISGVNAYVTDISDVVVVDCPDRPGAMGEITRKLGDADINLDFVYLATDERLVLGTRQTEEARAVLEEE